MDKNTRINQEECRKNKVLLCDKVSVLEERLNEEQTREV